MDTEPSNGDVASPITLDTDSEPCAFGDLLLALTTAGKVYHFLVSGLSLRLASPVWNKSLDPDSPFAGTVDSNGGQVGNSRIPVFNLFDDNPNALLIVLWIIHHKHDKVPESVTFGQLRDLAVVCDKYDCAGSIITTVDLWKAPWAKKALDEGCEDWLFIGPTFGDSSSFTDLTKCLLENMKVRAPTSGCEGGIFIGDKLLNISLVPQKVINEIVDRRRTIFENLIGILELYLNIIRNAPACDEWTESPGIYMCTEDCLSITYGSFLRWLERNKFDEYMGSHNRENLSKWDGSLKELFLTLEKVRISVAPSSSYMKILGSGGARRLCGLISGTNGCLTSNLRARIRAEGAKLSGLSPTEFLRFQRKYREWSS